jgi:hypothetical protein
VQNDRDALGLEDERLGGEFLSDGRRHLADAEQAVEERHLVRYGPTQRHAPSDGVAHLADFGCDLDACPGGEHDLDRHGRQA